MKTLRADFARKPVSVCTLVHIPELAGYWTHSLDVLKASLGSLLQNTTQDFDLIIFDNGSCQEVREFLLGLRDRGVIQLLMLSPKNMGKCGALNVLFPACPGELIAYADSDVFYRPGWLSESIRIFGAFERVGTVTARPSRAMTRLKAEHLSTTLAYAETASDISVERGDLIPHEVLADHARSIGNTTEEFLKVRTPEDIRITRAGVSAYVYSAHYQFVAPKSALMDALPLPTGNALGGDIEVDQPINAAGYLRLATCTARVTHLGNTIGPGELEELRALPMDFQPRAAVTTSSRSRMRPWLRRLAHSPRGRKMIRRAQAALFEMARE